MRRCVPGAGRTGDRRARSVREERPATAQPAHLRPDRAGLMALRRPVGNAATGAVLGTPPCARAASGRGQDPRPGPPGLLWERSGGGVRSREEDEANYFEGLRQVEIEERAPRDREGAWWRPCSRTTTRPSARSPRSASPRAASSAPGCGRRCGSSSACPPSTRASWGTVITVPPQGAVPVRVDGQIVDANPADLELIPIVVQKGQPKATATWGKVFRGRARDRRRRAGQRPAERDVRRLHRHASSNRGHNAARRGHSGPVRPARGFARADAAHWDRAVRGALRRHQRAAGPDHRDEVGPVGSSPEVLATSRASQRRGSRGSSSPSRRRTRTHGRSSRAPTRESRPPASTATQTSRRRRSSST